MSDTTVPDDLITPREAKKVAKVCLKTVYRWMERGYLAKYRRVGRWFVSLSEVLALTVRAPEPAREDKPPPPVASPYALAKRKRHTELGLRRLGYIA